LLPVAEKINQLDDYELSGTAGPAGVAFKVVGVPWAWVGSRTWGQRPRLEAQDVAPDEHAEKIPRVGAVSQRSSAPQKP